MICKSAQHHACEATSALQAVREGKPRWWGAIGCLVLVTYGFVPTAQPVSVFGRIYAGAALHAAHACTPEAGVTRDRRWWHRSCFQWVS